MKTIGKIACSLMCFVLAGCFLATPMSCAYFVHTGPDWLVHRTMSYDRERVLFESSPAIEFTAFMLAIVFGGLSVLCGMAVVAQDSTGDGT